MTRRVKIDVLDKNLAIDNLTDTLEKNESLTILKGKMDNL